MKRTIILPVLLAGTLFGCVLAFANRGLSIRGAGTRLNDHSPNVKAGATSVLVELFTSEGCSSCPPADALLARLAKSSGVEDAQVIPMEEHVDYWNHLGWADPFSAAKYTERQRSYMQLMHLDQVYTPQMVVDGRVELLGSDESDAHSAITSSLQIPKSAALITVKDLRDTGLTIDVRIDPIRSLRDGEPTDVVVAVTEDNLDSNVVRGENAGHGLSHIGVVRTWQLIGHNRKNEPFAESVKIALDTIWKKPNLNAVVFVQGHVSGQVYAVATAKIDAARQD